MTLAAGLYCLASFAVIATSSEPEHPAPAAEALEVEDATDRLKVLVLPMRAEGVPDALGASVAEMIASLLFKRQEYRVFTLGAVNAMIENEMRKDLVGCSDVACATEIGAALDVERIVAGTLSRVGERFALSAAWIDAEFSEQLAQSTATVSKEEYLPNAATRVVEELLDHGATADGQTRQLKLRPTFWTVEVAGGWAAPIELESYDRGYAGSLRLSWGGKANPSSWYAYALAGVDFVHTSGETRGTNGFLRYARTFYTPHLEFRAAFPLAFRQRLRLTAGAGIGVGIQRHSLRRPGEVNSSGATWLFEVRGSGGLWYKVARRMSLFANYRLRLLIPGAGADPVSEAVRQGTSEKTFSLHVIEAGVIWHF